MDAAKTADARRWLEEGDHTACCGGATRPGCEDGARMTVAQIAFRLGVVPSTVHKNLGPAGRPAVLTEDQVREIKGPAEGGRGAGGARA